MYLMKKFVKNCGSPETKDFMPMKAKTPTDQ
jgi:hypothetical protein